MNLADKQNIISTIFDKTNLVSVNASLTNTGDARNELQKYFLLILWMIILIEKYREVINISHKRENYDM